MSPISTTMTELPYGLAGKIYRSPLPFSPLFDPQGDLLDAFRQADVDRVVILAENDEILDLTGRDIKALYHKLGFKVVEMPVVDFSIPEEIPFRQTVEETLGAAAKGETIVVHCHAGIGRTGMFTACMAKQVLGLNAREAVAWVRQYVPEAVESPRQYQFVWDY